MRMWTVGILSSCLLVIGCGKSPQGYFPLEKGMEWKYHLSVGVTGGKNVTAEVTRTVMDKRTLQGRQVVPVRTESSGTMAFEFLVSDDAGITAVAEQKGTDTEPVALPINYLLKFPLTKGAMWKSIRALGTGQAPVSLECTITGDDEVIATDAGKFKNALEMTCTGTVQQLGTPDTNVEAHLWFVHGIGNVKTQAKVTTKPGAPEVDIIMTLASFNK